MPLRKQPVTIGFSGGLHTKADAKQVPVTKLLDLQNATFDKATTLVKRNGYRSLGLGIEGTAGSTISNLLGVGVRDDEIIVFDGSNAYSRREDNDAWSDTGEVISAVTQDRAIGRTGTQQGVSDHATANGVTAVAWEDSRGGVWCSVVDAVTGRIIVSDTQLDAAAQQPRCLAIGSRIVVLYAIPSQLRIYALVIDSANTATLPTATVLVEDLSTALPYYDAVYAADDSPDFAVPAAFLAWSVNSGGISLAYIAEDGTIGSALNALPIVAHQAVTVAGPLAVAWDRIGEGTCGVVYVTTGQAIALLTVNPGDLSAVDASTTICAAGNTVTRVVCDYATVVDLSSPLWWAAERQDATTPTNPTLNFIQCGCVSFTGTTIVDGTTRILRGHCLASRAFRQGSISTSIGTQAGRHVYVCVVHPVTYSPYLAVVRMSGSVWGSRTVTVARLLPGLAAPQLTRAIMPSVQPVDPTGNGISDQFAITLCYRVQLTVDDSQTVSNNFSETGLRRVTLDFDNDNAYQTAQLGKGLYLAGALISHYDGSRWAEAGFHTAPDLPLGGVGGFVAVPSGSGGSIAVGTYGYIAWYEEIDNQGEVHRGPTSIPVLVTTVGASSSVTLTVPTCRLTSKKNVRIVIARSVNGASEYFRITSLDPSVTVGSNRYLANDPTVDTVTLVDAFSDTTLQTKQPAYTNGGILSNDPSPSSGACIAGGKFRLFWTDPSDPDVVRYSQPLTENDDAMSESASLSQRVDPYGGAIVGLGVIDDAVIVYKETAVHLFGGSGPDADGGLANPNNAWTPSALLTSDVGCSSPKSIVNTPIGQMFATQKGLCLLGRDRQVQINVGDDVYGFKDQIISRATLLPDRRQIVFLTADDDGSTLLYDYEHQQWSRYTNHLGYDAVVAAGVYHYLRTDGRVFRETPGLYADDTSHIPMLISTAWIKFTGTLQSFQKCIYAGISGTYKSAHQLQMRYRLDYEEGWSAPRLASPDTVYNPSAYGTGAYGTGAYGGTLRMSTVYQEKWHINRRCQAIAFEFMDIEATSTFGAAFELSELMLTGGVLGAALPIGANRSQ